MLTFIAIAILITAFIAWVVSLVRRAARYDRKQEQDLNKIRYMDNHELSEIINQHKTK